MVELHYQGIVRDSSISVWGNVFFNFYVRNFLLSCDNVINHFSAFALYLFYVMVFFPCKTALLFSEMNIGSNFVFRAPIGQGYGLTETCAGAAFSEWDDISVGRVGPPLPCGYIKV